MKDFYITKNKGYRINFFYKGKHYSIQECGELYEEFVSLKCKEDQNFYKTICYGHIPALIKISKRGETYRDADMAQLFKIIEEYIEKDC